MMPSKYYEGFVNIFTLKIIILAAQMRDSGSLKYL